ncbi:MAG: C-GCAxxG-C-C family (seleno)protein [Clostridium sp.]
MLVDRARELWDKKYDLNCAECILYAANEEYKLDLSKQTLKAVAGFGGGIAIEDVCGAALGAVSAIGIMFTNERGHESPIVRELTGEFMKKFNEKLGTHKCDELKAKYRKDDIHRCIHMIEVAAETLDEVVKAAK